MEVHTEKHIRRINKINRDACGFGVVSQRFLASLYQVVEFVSVAPVLEHNPVRAPIIRVTLNEFECSFFVLTLPSHENEHSNSLRVTRMIGCSFFVLTLPSHEYFGDFWACSFHGPVTKSVIIF